MNVLINILLVLAAFLFMEFIAWFTHKYVMHGFMWFFHRDHHIRDGRKIERNDIFAVIFAVPSILLIYFGVVISNNYLVSEYFFMVSLILCFMIFMFISVSLS